jgi:hypothetical protein
MKTETYKEMEKRLERNAWIGIGIAILLPIAFIVFFNSYIINLI